MTKQNQGADSKKDTQRGRVSTQQAISDNSPMQQGPEGVLTDLLLNLGGTSGESPAQELTNTRWQAAQRTRVARRLGRLQGNHLLQKRIRESENPTEIASPATQPEGGLAEDLGGPRSTKLQRGEQTLKVGFGSKRDRERAPHELNPPSNAREQVSCATDDQISRESEQIVRRPNVGEAVSAGQEVPTISNLRVDAHRGVVQRQGEGGRGGSSAPIPTLPDPARRRSLALDILKKAYGGLIKEESKVIGMPNEGLLRASYDNAMIVMGRVFIKEDGTERPWAPGDSRKHPDMSSELSGFYDPSSKQVYVDLGKEPDAQVATLVHELLHANASPEFGATLGKDLDEGLTEKLTQLAFTKSGYTPPSGFFAGQVGYVEELSAIVGLNTLKYTYFNGTASLRSMMDAKLEEGVFERFAIEVRNKNWGWLNKFFERYARAMQGTETEKKIVAINSLLDGWVSDTDLDNIENIWSAASHDEKAEIRKAISPRIGSLIDIGQRTRLRTMLAS
jgi:hypothetical protein